jgi:hypothetical protein
MRERTALQPSREAIEWGRRQAKHSPPWTAEKWRTVGVIFGTELAIVDQQDGTNDTEQSDDANREAA